MPSESVVVMSICPFPATGSEATSVTSCKTCNAIESAGKEKWCFEWLRQLKDYEDCLETEKAERDRQVRLMVDHTDDKVIDIRYKLAILQTQTPVWKLIELIQEHAELHALRHSNNLQHNDTSGQDDSADMRIKCMAHLVGFVEWHINKMLQTLYEQIEEEESRQLTEESSDCFESIERHWFINLYRKSAGNVQKRFTVVGPLGERPLHVCALSKCRFGTIDFEQQGNYFAEGVENGIKMYIQQHRPITKEVWRNVTMPYGKDYCAAVGDFIKHQENELDEKLKGWGDVSKFKAPAPPFWDDLKDWYHKHLQQRKVFDISETYSKMLVTRGLYEGETILFPFIAENDEHMVSWLLDKEEELLKGSRDAQPPPNFAGSPSPARRTQNETPIQGLSFLQTALTGLFFHPMHRRCLTSFSVIKGWSQYIRMRLRDMNLEAASRRSYFGLSLLAFAASQGKVGTFNLVLNQLEGRLIANISDSDLLSNGISKMRQLRSIRHALVNIQDEYGNTLLHLAVWDGQIEMIDRLVHLGADMKVYNLDGLTPFTLAARYGVWKSFNHMWDKHVTKTIWKFGNVEKRALDFSSFDWKGIKTFSSKKEVEVCLKGLVESYENLTKGMSTLSDLKIPPAKSQPESNFQVKRIEAQIKYNDLVSKVEIVEQWIASFKERKASNKLKEKIVDWLKMIPKDNETKSPIQGCLMNGWLGSVFNHLCSENVYRQDSEERSALRMITLFRPADWYDQSKDKIENVIMEKWENGYHLVHLGQSVVPYFTLLIIFGIMWSERELHVLSHDFWWADKKAVSTLKDDIGLTVLRNPVVANITELIQVMNSSIFGSDPVQTGRQPKYFMHFFGPESKCGWEGITSSVSGRLQAVQVVYGVLSMLRLAIIQRRIRPSDLDENEDMKFSFDELVNFVYFNLESLLHLILCGLYVAIAAARITAGEACSTSYVIIEKNVTAIAGLFLFLNLLTVCKPYKGIGLLVLSMYKFLVSDVFNFLVVYSMLFTGFLLALQTFHNTNRAYMAWLDVTTKVFPQVAAVTDHSAYLMNHNPPDSANQLETTHMAMDGCGELERAFYDTAFTLLQISFGDGFADALAQGRRSDYQCAGLRPDMLVNYILVFWLFVTNVLILNMLIAMMNTTFMRQTKNVHAVWLLDVSYRIMRFEKLFPELKDRMRTSRAELKNQMRSSRSHYSILSRIFWQQLLWDICLVLYCLPEIHEWGYTHAAFVWIWRKFNSQQSVCTEGSEPDGFWVGSLEGLKKALKDLKIDETEFNSASSFTQKALEMKGLCLEQRVMGIAKLRKVVDEVDRWHSLFHEKWARFENEPTSADCKSPPCNLNQQEPTVLNNVHLILLHISLIYRLDLIMQNFDASCIVHDIKQQPPESGETASPLSSRAGSGATQYARAADKI